MQKTRYFAFTNANYRKYADFTREFSNKTDFSAQIVLTIPFMASIKYMQAG